MSRKQSPFGFRKGFAIAVIAPALCSICPTARSADAPAAADSQTSAAAATVPDYSLVAFSTLGGFEYPEDGIKSTTASAANSPIPKPVQALDNRRVTIQGFMVPIDMDQGEVKTFLLQGNQMQCCYGVPPRINELVSVKSMKAGTTYIPDVPVAVRGTFHVGEVRSGPDLVAIYTLDAESVAEVSP